MVTSLRAWWQRNKKTLEITGVSIFLIVLLALVVFIILGYIYNWSWVGIGPNAPSFQHGKTLWDWLQLLIIPAVLAVGGYVFNFTVSRNEQKSTQLRNQTERDAAVERDQTERDIAADNQQEAALQDYIDKMSELLLDKKLRDSSEDDEVRNIARVRTLTVLPRLDKDRKKSVLIFLHESVLINKFDTINVMHEADLSGAIMREVKLDLVNLRKTDLSRANLYGAYMVGADLSYVNLNRADLTVANLREADLSGANLSGADLSYANLRGADLTDANLTGTSLNDTQMYGANLSGALLDGADLSGANMSETNLENVTVAQKQLDEARSLKGATMPDGSIHP